MSLGAPADSSAQSSDHDHLEYPAAEQVTHDNNLYRLPVGFGDVNTIVGPGSARWDTINTLSAGIDGFWSLGLQALSLTLSVENNRFVHNTRLDNIAYSGKLSWNWQSGPRWSGDVGTEYTRSLVNFADNRIFVRDLVSNSTYFADARYLVWPGWSVTGGIRHAQSSQSAAAARINDLRSTGGSAGAEYRSSAGNTVGVTYAYTSATLPQGVFVNAAPFDRNYKDDELSVRLNYALTAITSIQATGGYLKRNYRNEAIGGFSGDTWRISLQIQPDVQVQMAIAAWRNLTAYLDAQSEYFVSSGASITPSWSPTSKLTTSVAFSVERQNYIGSNPQPAASPLRRDTIRSAQAQLTYNPVKWLEVDGLYHWQDRASNRSALEYADNLASVAVRVRF